MSNALIAAVIAAATEDGSWVNDPVEGIVRNARTGQGKKPSKADLHEVGAPGTKVLVSWFSGDLMKHEGCVVRISGKGTKAKIYKGAVELEVGKNASVELVGRAPASEAPPAAHAAASSTSTAGHAAETPEAHATRFHTEMKRIALLRVHAHQYALDVARKIGLDLENPQDFEEFLSTVTSMFMTAKDRGLLERPPAPRAVDTECLPLPYTPPATQHDPEAEKRAAEAARIAAEEAKRKAADEARRAEADSDVPF